MASKIARMFENLHTLKSADDILDVSGTNWDAQMVQPAYVVDGVLKKADDGGYGMIIRPDSGTVLSMRSKSHFRMARHRAHIHALQPLLDSGDIIPASVSVWDNGAVMAFQFRCPNLDMVIHDRDVVSPLLTLAFAYTGTMSDSAFFADFRWFCKNQMGKVAAITETSDKVRHSGNVDGKYADVLKDKISKMSGELAGHYDILRKMTTKPLPRSKELHTYIGKSLDLTEGQIEASWVAKPEDIKGPASAIPKVLECYAVDDAGAAGTVWHAYNAVTRYETHEGLRKRGGEEASRVNATRQLLGLQAGNKAAHVAEAFVQAAKLVAA